MVLHYNPAGLVALRGDKLLLDVNLALFDACVQPIGLYGWGAYRGGSPTQFDDPKGKDSQLLFLGNRAALGDEERDYYRDPLDEVCLSHRPLPLPQLLWTSRVSETLGVGFGVMFPPIQPTGRFGGEHGLIRQEDGQLRPSPVRYMQLSSANRGVFPTFGLAYRLFDALRVGLAFQVGVLEVANQTMAASNGGTTPNRDIVAKLTGGDSCVHAVLASVHLVPNDAIDLVARFKWQDAVDAKGEIEFTTGRFDPALRPHTSTVEVDSIRQALPWHLTLGFRYADRLLPRPVGSGAGEARENTRQVLHDPMQDEAWDVEIDVEYQANSVNQQQEVWPRLGQGIEARCAAEDPGCSDVREEQISSVEFPEPSAPVTVVEKHWQDQLSIRIGASWNPLPGALSLSAGAHYENRGVDADFMQIDFWPLERLGLHAGVTIRISGMADLTFSYAHIFQETLVVAPPAHRARGLGGFDKTIGPPPDRSMPLDCDAGGADPDYCVAHEPPLPERDGVAQLRQSLTKSASDDPAWIVNAGEYRSHFDLLSVGLSVHF